MLAPQLPSALTAAPLLTGDPDLTGWWVFSFVLALVCGIYGLIKAALAVRGYTSISNALFWVLCSTVSLSLSAPRVLA